VTIPKSRFPERDAIPHLNRETIFVIGAIGLDLVIATLQTYISHSLHMLFPALK
jgi:hypothetical protein